jgi:hypothetical protein
MISKMMAVEPFAKNYDVVVKVWVEGEVCEFALEYERSLKSVPGYEKIRELMDGEQRFASVLYLTASADILIMVDYHLSSPSQQIAFATARSFEQSLLGTSVATDSSGDLVSFERFLRCSHPLYRRI